MAENKLFDLNALRAESSVSETEKPKTKEEKIALLKEEIRRLKEEAEKPSPYEEFFRLTEDQKEQRLAEVNTGLPSEERYSSIEEYVEDIRPKGALNPWRLRLAVAESELRTLEE